MYFREYQLRCILLLWIFGLTHAATNQTDPSICNVIMDGVTLQKQVGDVWSSTDDLCLKHTCELDQTGGPIESTFSEYCSHSCPNDYDLVPKLGQCCGECIRKRCTYANTTYDIGDMWKSTDKCQFYECSANAIADNITEAKIVSYRKSCPPLQNCPSNKTYMKDCCTFCSFDQQPKNQSEFDDFVHWADKYDGEMSRDTYMRHPCRRECISGASPKVCEYIFVVEWYETLSKACFECPNNTTDCNRPHCIYADGSPRSVLVVNRMMPGPAIEVCKDDTIVVDVQNHLMGESTTIHWHGLHQRDTPFYDGAPQITQCPISPHTTFRYTVKASNAGTHWWHSHVGMQRADGAFGALIIREPLANLPPQIRNSYDYDTIDYVMLLQDWDPQPGVPMFNSFHHSVGDNKPANILVNGKGRFYGSENTAVLSAQIETTTAGTTTTTTVAASTTTAPTTAAAVTDAAETTLPALLNGTEASSEVVANVTEATSVAPEITTTTTTSTDGTPSTTTQQKTNEAEPLNTTSTVKTASELVPYAVFNVQTGSRYRFRTINSGFLNCPLEISVDNHTLLVIASDGHYFEPITVDTLVSYAGERFDFVVNANQPVDNYWIRIKGLMDCDERFTKAHQAAIFRYNGANEEIPIAPLSYEYRRGGFQMNSLNRGPGHVDSVAIVETTSLEPDTPELLAEKTDFQFYVYYDFYDKNFPHFNHPKMYPNLGVTFNSTRFFGPQLNHITMKMPPTPFLLGREQNDERKYCNSSSLLDRGINCQKDFCECTHVFQVPLNATVEVVLIDEGYKYDANHPFHLHGHDFRVVAMERVEPKGVTVDQIKKLDETNAIKRRLSGAPIKDTVTVPDGGYTIIRFLANNPGFWLFHCHIEFHVEVGMALVFKVGDYHQMPRPPRNFPTCSNFVPHMSQSGAGDSASSLPKLSYSLFAIIAVGSTIIMLVSYLQ